MNLGRRVYEHSDPNKGAFLYYDYWGRPLPVKRPHIHYRVSNALVCAHRLVRDGDDGGLRQQRVHNPAVRVLPRDVRRDVLLEDLRGLAGRGPPAALEVFLLPPRLERPCTQFLIMCTRIRCVFDYMHLHMDVY